jgi:hypothetical protein
MATWQARQWIFFVFLLLFGDPQDTGLNHSLLFLSLDTHKRNKGCVTHCGLAIYIKKDYRRIMEIQIFHHAEIQSLQKNTL